MQLVKILHLNSFGSWVSDWLSSAVDLANLDTACCSINTREFFLNSKLFLNIVVAIPTHRKLFLEWILLRKLKTQILHLYLEDHFDDEGQFLLTQLNCSEVLEIIFPSSGVSIGVMARLINSCPKLNVFPCKGMNTESSSKVLPLINPEIVNKWTFLEIRNEMVESNMDFLIKHCSNLTGMSFSNNFKHPEKAIKLIENCAKLRYINYSTKNTGTVFLNGLAGAQCPNNLSFIRVDCKKSFFTEESQILLAKFVTTNASIDFLSVTYFDEDHLQMDMHYVGPNYGTNSSEYTVDRNYLTKKSNKIDHNVYERDSFKLFCQHLDMDKIAPIFELIGNVENIELEGAHFTDDILKKIETYNPKFKKLSLISCNYCKEAHMFLYFVIKCCSALTHLSVTVSDSMYLTKQNGNRLLKTFIQFKMDNITHLELHSFSDAVDDEYVGKLLDLQTQLTYLKLVNCTADRECIVDYLDLCNRLDNFTLLNEVTEPVAEEYYNNGDNSDKDDNEQDEENENRDY